MTEKQLNEGCRIRKSIVYVEQDIVRFKRLRDDIAKSKGFKDEMSIINCIMCDFSHLSENNPRTLAWRARLMVAATEIVDEELQMLGNELIELQKAMDEI